MTDENTNAENKVEEAPEQEAPVTEASSDATPENADASTDSSQGVDA